MVVGAAARGAPRAARTPSSTVVGGFLRGRRTRRAAHARRRAVRRPGAGADAARWGTRFLLEHRMAAGGRSFVGSRAREHGRRTCARAGACS